MSAMASQITGVSIVCSTVCSDADQRKHQKHCVIGLCEGNPPVTGGFPSQRASNAENVSIWWRHHVLLARQWTLATLFIGGHDIAECLSRQTHWVECQHRSSCHMLLPAFWVSILTPCPVVIPVHMMMKSHEVASRWGLFYYHGLTLIPACISNRIPSEVW